MITTTTIRLARKAIEEHKLLDVDHPETAKPGDQWMRYQDGDFYLFRAAPKSPPMVWRIVPADKETKKLLKSMLPPPPVP